MNAPVRIETMPRFASALKAIESLKPGEPLYLVHPEKFAAAARTVSRPAFPAMCCMR